MKYRNVAGLLRWISICFAVLLAALRVTILKTAFDENGLLPFGSLALPVTVGASACFFVVIWLLSLKLNAHPGRESAFSVQGIWLPMKLLAAGLLMAGSVLTLLNLDRLAIDDPETIISGVGALSGLLMVWNSMSERRGPNFFWVRLIPTLFTGAALVIRFRAWSHDPMVIHIVPLLLTWTCCMVEMMLLSGFSLKVGHRRSSVLFGLSAGMFACMAIPDFILTQRLALTDLLTILGLALWCVVAALELLRERTQSK